jgi:hypothetical protein
VCTTTFEAAESVNVRYFFPKWDTQNPSANPNCFYYWCQTGANNGHGNISYCSSTIHDGVATAGFFDPATPNLIYVCGKRTDEAGHRDIMYFSKTVIHEGLHRTHYNQTHGVGASPDADGDWLHDGLETCDDLNLNGVRDHEPYTDSNDNGQYDYGEPFEDIGLIRMELTLAEFRSGIPARAVRYGDGNGSWDQEGPNMNGTSRYHANTRGGLYDDEDDTCYAIEANAANASNEDWSKPGQQW